MSDDRTLIMQWHKHELGQNYASRGPARLIMGMPVWGEPYVSRFLEWGLPSILSSRDALDAYGWELILYVDEKTWPPQAIQQGLPVQIRFIPQLLLEIMARGGVAKYWLLGAIHNLLIHEAGQRDAAWHMLVADIVYSENYFGNLIQLGEDHVGIAQHGMTANFGKAERDLILFRRPDGVLSLPATILGHIGWACMVAEFDSWAMDGIDDPLLEMPDSHSIHWRGDNHVRMHSAHMSAAWLSPERCKQAGTDVGGTIDSELPRYVGPDFYIPQRMDNMAYISLADGYGYPTPRTTFRKWKQSLLDMIGNRADHFEFFKAPCIVPAEPIKGYPDARELDKRFHRLLELMESQNG